MSKTIITLCKNGGKQDFIICEGNPVEHLRNVVLTVRHCSGIKYIFEIYHLCKLNIAFFVL